uniref:Uncharacterized protein n=1 Tax=Candidatus Kentrum sp. TUN TaxID=2126343 RepID=A0A451A6Z2_9GAMM|nr:MAG: hypothetical protein BECKTUN1418D_GA0071000_11602 [Candidatus Kentron sp. TUN]
MNMTILVRWFTWVWLRWKYQFGMFHHASRDIKALSSHGQSSYSGNWITPSEEEICRDFEQLEDSNIDYFKWISIGIWLIVIAFIWLILRATDVIPELITIFSSKALRYPDITMGVLGGLGTTVLIIIFFAANDDSPLHVTKEEATGAIGNLRVSGEAGRRPTPWWQQLLLLIIVAFEAGIFGSLMLSYVGDFTNTQNLIAGFAFGVILAIVLTVMTHKAGKAIYIAHHRSALAEAVARETARIVEKDPSDRPIERSETFGKIKQAFGPIQFDGNKLSFWTAAGIPTLTLILVASVAVTGFIVRDNIQRNIIDMLKRQQMEETTLREELSLLNQETIAPQEIMGEINAAQAYQADSFAANEMIAARASILIIAVTFIGLQIITTIIGYQDGFDFSENTTTYYPHLQAYEKSSRILTEDTLNRHNQDRLKSLYRRVDSILAGYYKTILRKTVGNAHTAVLHNALESRKPMRFETYRKRNNENTKPH